MALTKDISQHAPASTVAGWLRAATNLFRRGEADSLSDWQSTTGVTLSLDGTVQTPLGSPTVKAVCDGLSATQGVRATSAVGQAAPVGELGIGSIYFRGQAGLQYRYFMRWQNTDATVSDQVEVDFIATGAMQLLSPPSWAVQATKTGDALLILVTTTGTRADTFWVGNAMLERAQSAVAPYVKTSGGSTSTRRASEQPAEVAKLIARFKSNAQDPVR